MKTATGMRAILSIGLAMLLVACGSTPQRRQDSEFLRLIVAADRSYQRKDFTTAQRQYQDVLAAKPDYVPAHIRLGAIAYEQGDNATATEQFRRALSKDARNTQARYNLALIALDDARQWLRQYLELQPAAPNRQRIEQLLSELAQFGAQ